MLHQQLLSGRDHTDWQFAPSLYRSYDLRYGPFDIEACSNSSGSNALCPAWWSPSDSYTQHQWSRKKIWCKSPHSDISKVSDKAIEGFELGPDNTCTLLVLPDWPDAVWWPQLTKSG